MVHRQTVYFSDQVHDAVETYRKTCEHIPSFSAAVNKLLRQALGLEVKAE